MSGRRRKGISPSLFPFLAVLVCTLGTLILLLAMVSQKASEAAAAGVANATAPPAADQADDQEEAEAVAQATAQIDRQLREAKWYREQTVKMRDEQTAELEQRRDQLAHLEDHLARLREQLRLLTAEVEASLEDQGTLLTAQATLDQLLTQIEEEKAATRDLQEKLQSQTPRIVIVPHQGPNGTDRRPIYVQCRSDGVYLQPGGQRILRAQLEAASTHANPLDAALRAIRLHAMQAYGDSVAPYPLLIVSPDGIETYGLARAAMNSWDDQFGYELVPAGAELAFPPADPVLEDKVATAIRQAVAQQETLALRSGGGRGRGGNAAGHGSATSGTAGSGTAGSGTAGSGTAGSGTASAPRAASLPVLSAAQLSRGGLAAEEAGRRLDQQHGPGAAGSGSALSPLAATATESGSATAAAQPGTTAPTTAQRGAATGLALQDMALDPPQVADGTDDDSQQVTGQHARPTAGQPADPAGKAGANGPVGKSTAAISSGSPGGSGGPQAAGTESMSGSPDPQQPSSGSPSISLSASATPPVTRVGKDWGLPTSLASSRGTEMLRTIRVECHPDRFVLLPEGGRGAKTTFAFADGDVNRASLELATAVRDRAAGWGAAMQGARWQPVLDVAVVTGGESRYQQLQQLMDGSGVIIQARGTR